VYAVAVFKVALQTTIGKVGNSIMCLWADMSATVKELLKSDSI